MTPLADPIRPAGPVFVVAPLAGGGRRVAQWLGGARPLVHARCGVLNRLCGPAGRARDDRWTGLDASTVRAAVDAERVDRGGRLQRVEHDPRLPLNVARVARWFPEAGFVFVYRDVREALGGMLDRWLGEENPHPASIRLSSGEAWCGPLPPGWSAWTRRPLAEVVAWQWSALMRQAIDELHALAPSRWCVVAYDRLLSTPEAEYRRLADFLRLPAERMPTSFAEPGAASPDPRRWLAHAERLTPKVLGIAAVQADRAVRLFAEPPRTRVRG